MRTNHYLCLVPYNYNTHLTPIPLQFHTDMRIIYNLIVAIAMFSAALPAYSQEIQAKIGGLNYTLYNDEYVAVVDSDDEYSQNIRGHLTIPAYVTYRNTQYPVVAIGASAFRDCYGLTSVTIPNTVYEIGVGAFYNCKNLTTVNIPNSVEAIWKEAFADCSSLKVLVLPNSLTEIGDWVFSNCSSLTSVNIPNSVQKIGDGAFEYCTSLSTVTVPAHTQVASDAFKGTRGYKRASAGQPSRSDTKSAKKQPKKQNKSAKKRKTSIYD